jgi:2-oxoglutarate dehydrogenase complex dehydrogenase (E1) component-like enzyme
MPPTEAESGPARTQVNAWLVAEMEERFREDPTSVPADWQAHFRAGGSVTNGGTNGGDQRYAHERFRHERTVGPRSRAGRRADRP